MTRPEPLITARKAQADATRQRAHKALATMIRAREPITFAAVASRAQVSREYLYRTTDLASKIRDARSTSPAHLREETPEEPRSVVAALRDHVRRLEAQHATSIAGLRAENTQLRRELEAALGRILASDAAGLPDLANRHGSAEKDPKREGAHALTRLTRDKAT